MDEAAQGKMVDMEGVVAREKEKRRKASRRLMALSFISQSSCLS